MTIIIILLFCLILPVGTAGGNPAFRPDPSHHSAGGYASECATGKNPSHNAAGDNSSQLSDTIFRIIFYNVENLFDTEDEPGKNDSAFTPEGERRWNHFRLRNKINNIYKALAAAGGSRIPPVIGLCEVENMHVLKMLAYQTGLRNHNYSIIHRDSPDHRGIDVAVLYRKDDFTVIDTIFRQIRFPFDTLAATRDILYIKGISGISDTLHLFVNHWPSRWGGQAATVPYRNFTAGVLRSMTDSLFAINPDACVIIMGDFNDEPEDISLRRYLGAKTDVDGPGSGKLYNISSPLKRNNKGTLKFQGEWFLFDQFIVSGSLLNGVSVLQACLHSVRIFSADFMLVADDPWFGFKPFRSYEGFRYTGGFSDHLPVILDLHRKSNAGR